MDGQTRLWSRLGLLGGAYAALFVVALVLFGSTPGSGASGADVVKYYQAHRTAQIAGVFVIVVAIVALTFFLASLRRTLSQTDDGRFLANVVTVGGTIYAVGIAVMSVLTLAMVDAAHHDLVGTAQTLNVLNGDTWLPVITGLSLLGLGTGIAVLRGATMPKWLGWASVVFGVLALAGPAGAIAFMLAPVWALATGIVILRGGARQEVTISSPAASLAHAQT
jgi:hypothetical protein